MSNKPPPPVKNFGKLYASQRYVMQQLGDKPGAITDSAIAECYGYDAPLAQAKRYARLFAAAPRLLAFVAKCAAFDDTAACERLASTGSYGSFDNPDLVKEARALLSDIPL